MPEWGGLVLKLIGTAGAAVFGILGLGIKARDDDGGMTQPGRVALIGILVSAIIASASTIYDFGTAKSKEAADQGARDQSWLETLRSRYPLRGVYATVSIQFAQDFPALDAYKSRLSAGLPKFAKECKDNSFYECMDSDDGGIKYGIRSTSPLFPKPTEFIKKALDGIYISVSFLKPNVIPANKPFQRIGSFNFSATKYGFDEVHVEFQPQSGDLWYVIQRSQIPDDAVMFSNIYSLAEAFPGVVSATSGVGDFRPLCELKTPTLSAACQTALPRKELNSIRIESLGLRFPYPKMIGLDTYTSMHCTSSDGEESLNLALPNDIEKVDALGNISVGVDQRTSTNGLCNALDDPGL